VAYFEKTSMPVLRRLEALRADAQAAAQALRAWSEHSERKADQEAMQGGTCPARAESRGARGPIAMFREGEVAIAGDLHRAMSAKVVDLGAKLESFGASKPTNFEQASARM